MRPVPHREQDLEDIMLRSFLVVASIDKGRLALITKKEKRLPSDYQDRSDADHNHNDAEDNVRDEIWRKSHGLRAERNGRYCLFLALAGLRRGEFRSSLRFYRERVRRKRREVAASYTLDPVFWVGKNSNSATNQYPALMYFEASF